MPAELDTFAGDDSLAPPANRAGTLSDAAFDAILIEQHRDWTTGRRTPVAEWLRRFPALAGDAMRVAEMAYHEFVLRQGLGQSPAWEDYLRQFPASADALSCFRRAEQVVEQALPTADLPATLTTQLDDYDVLEEVGRGGMGVVLKARQRSLDRIVALKRLRAGATSGEEARQRFRREALALARLQHPNIVQIYGVGEADEQPFLALEFIAGGSLADRLAQRSGTLLPARAAAPLVEVLARAVEYAHGNGIVHRDLKPANVLLAGPHDAPPEQWGPKVTDFGLAKRLDGENDTRSGAVLGTPGYMAPEQAGGPAGGIGPWTDVYGLGAILYELLTGQPPFRAEAPLQTLQQIAGPDPVRPCSLINPSVPRDLETVCLKCLEKTAARRYASAAALADDLGRWLRGEPVLARRIGPFARAARWARRRPVVAVLLLLLGTVVVGSGAALTALWRQAEEGAAAARASAALAEERRKEEEESAKGAHALLTEIIVAGQGAAAEAFTARREHQIGALRHVEDYCRDRLRRHPDDHRTRAALVDTCGALARLHTDCQRWTEAENYLRAAEAALAELPSSSPVDAELLARLIESYGYLAGLCTPHGDFGQTRRALCRAAALADRLARDHPGPAARLVQVESWSHLENGAEVSGERLDAFAATVRQGGELLRDGRLTLEDRARFVSAQLNLGGLYARAHREDEAIRCWRSAHEEAGKLLGESGGVELKRLRAVSCKQMIGHPQVEPYHGEAVRLFEQVADEEGVRAERDPTNLPLQHNLASTLSFIAQCHQRAGATEQSLQALGRYGRQLERVAALYSSPASRLKFVDELCYLATAYLEAGDSRAALERARQAVAALDRVAAPSDESRPSRETRAAWLPRISHVAHRAGDLPKALALAEEARHLLEGLLRESPDRLDLGYGLWEAWEEISKVHTTADREAEAARARVSGVEVLRELVKRAPDVDLYRSQMGDRCMRLGRYFRGAGQLPEAEKWFLEQEKLWPDNAKALKEVSREFRKLADSMGQGQAEISPEEEAERRRYLAESERTRRAAEKHGE
jgi:tetratricopeptide (TPR) repeat protein/tRNA A-37 threonylcarbamoyl transferase component Bud32